MNTNVKTAGSSEVPAPTLAQAFNVWLQIGLLSFGGPAAQIALMHREIVDKRKWLSEKQYLNALSFCMLLPGPEAMQIATYAGWRLHGTIGGLIAGLLFVLPGAFIILFLAMIYASYGEVPLINALFLGVKAAVIIVVIEALLRVAKRALALPEHWIIAALAFVGIFFFRLPFPLIIVAAAIFGFIRSAKPASDEVKVSMTVSTAAAVNKVLIWLAIWWIPILAIGFLYGDGLLLQIGVFFSKLAVVTFGGAYAVLAYLGQDVVSQFGWLTTGEMMDGLGLAETTPGPLILVNEFVGYLAAFRAGGVSYGILGAVMTLWATFVPCFLWIFVGAPYIDWISAQPRLKSALIAITAAVVGVILNLSIWFGLQVMFTRVTEEHYGPLVLMQPELASLDVVVLGLTAMCAVLLFKFHWGIGRVLLLSSLGGLLFSL